MMRRSGVSPPTYLSKLAREMLRLAASGHSPSRQDSKLAAARRIAAASICGWPDEPDSPVHSFGGVGAGTAAGGASPCAKLAAAVPSANAQATISGAVPCEKTVLTLFMWVALKLQ